MPKRVIFFLDSAFSKRDYIRFGFDIFRARGYAVEAWDFLPVLRPGSYRHYTPPDPVDFSGYRLFTDSQHIVEAVSALSNDDVVVSLLMPCGSSTFIFDWLYKKNIRYGHCFMGLLPTSIQQRFHEQLHGLFSSPSVFFGKMLSRILQGVFASARRSQRTHAPSFMITGGAASTWDRRYHTLDPINVIKAHAFDYDRYLEEEALVHLDEEVSSVGYALFLDDDIPFHPEYLIFDINPYCTADSYYSELNKFFDSFERATGMPIIVAAHPRANYEKRGNPYGNRKLVFGKTVSYTKYSKLVLAHVSTSLNFAILYKKPVLFMDSLKYCMALRRWIFNTASTFGQKPLIISKELSFPPLKLAINDGLYEQYKHSYIKELETPNKMSWDIFCDYLDKLK